MKKLFLALAILMTSGCPLYAQCVAEIKDVLIDNERGSIIVETQYTLNGDVVNPRGEVCGNCVGRSRYTEESGTNEEIIARAKEDIAQHCENLIRRIPANLEYLQRERVIQQKALTAPIVEVIKKDLVGQTATKTEAVDTFKNKDIKVTYDQKNTVIDSVLTPTP